MTLGLNLYTQGINPKIDFAPMSRIIDMVEESNKISVHPRHPYGGDLVYCAFSGSHQDAIKKGFQSRKDNPSPRWQIPYLALDPKDIDRNYEAVIRINTQSGKGGASWIIQRTLELDLPRGLQQAFSKIVQKSAAERRRELLPKEIQKLFEESYLANSRFTLVDYNITADRASSPAPARGRSQNTANFKRTFDGVIAVDGKEQHIKGVGNGPISAIANALRPIGIDLDVGVYEEHAINIAKDEENAHPAGSGRENKAVAYIECFAAGAREPIWGVGISVDTVQASLIAILSAASSVSLSPDALLLSVGH